MNMPVIRCGLTVDAAFAEFVDSELLPGLNLQSSAYWEGIAAILAELTPVNRELLAVRDRMQEQIDTWHRQATETSCNLPEYKDFLTGIGYLETVGPAFGISTDNVDCEIAAVAGPQLVVPVSNARFALNAANARWGSFYDALYGTDAIPRATPMDPGDTYNPARGAAVIAYAAKFLDRSLPLSKGLHSEIVQYDVRDDEGSLWVSMNLADGSSTSLRDPAQFAGTASDGSTKILLFRNNGLHIELRFDPTHPIGRVSPSNLCDIHLESALTTIQDCEDSVAAVDAADKIEVYRNWLGLMRGTLDATFKKGGNAVTRTLASDRYYQGAGGKKLQLPGRSLMLVRNVGHLMTTDIIQDREGENIFEGILDAIITATCCLYDFNGSSHFRNSRAGSIYIVKPKMHGSSEAAFANRLFDAVEDLLRLDRNTIKIGVMDEERRTSANLAECIRAVQERLFFINTGFLDRTGDEIHTTMRAGKVLRKEAIKSQPWIRAYEDRNVDVGIQCGLPGRAQIGKGMWPMPDEMAAMLDAKCGHPEAGASCAWVPSPTAATLHATHYHEVDVAARQSALADRPMAKLDALLTAPLDTSASMDTDEIQAELDNNAQGILGYVVRWIDQGVGCSKVPDIHNIGLMEDRATLRISSQHIANWLLHGVCSHDQVLSTMQRMAKIVDTQNSRDPTYKAMAPDLERSLAFQAACDLVFKGVEQPNGYTEPLLHAFRRRRKSLG